LELKREAPPDISQLVRYEGALRELAGAFGCTYTLALVTKRDVELPGPLPPDVEHRTWQDVALLLTSLAAGGREASQLWLSREFVDYLEEEHLATIGPFTVEDALAIERYDDALVRIREIIIEAESVLMRRYSPPDADYASWGPKNDPLDFYRTFPIDTAPLFEDGSARPEAIEAWAAGASGPEARWFEWHARHDAARDHPLGQRAFGAGIAMRADDAFPADEYGDWLRGLAEEGFEYLPETTGHMWYLFRYLYPAQLVGGADVQQQSDHLVRWVDDSFRLLAASPPVKDRLTP